MKRVKIGLLIWVGMILGFILFPMEVNASEHTDVTSEFDYIDNWLSASDLDSINEGMDSLFPGIQIDAKQLLSMIMNGQVLEALKMFTGQIKNSLQEELAGLRQVFLYILVLGVVSALFSEFSDLFAGQQMAQAGFYFLYLFLMAILTKVFLFVSEIASDTMESIVLFVKMFIPTYSIVVGTAQGTASGVYYYQLMLMVAYLVESFLNGVLMPLICSYVMLALLNGLWTEEKLALLLEFIEKGISFSLKVAMGAVTGLSLVLAILLKV